MLSQRNPRLRRIDVVVNSINSCVSDAAKESTRTPEVSVSEMSSEPRMFPHKFKGGVPFKQLKTLANADGWRHFNKQMDMVNSDVKPVNFEFVFHSNFAYEPFTINLNPIKLERIHRILAFPHKVESVLSKLMAKTFQIHFLSPEHSSHYIHKFNSEGLESRPSVFNQLVELNFGGGNSSLGLKPEVPLPRM